MTSKELLRGIGSLKTDQILEAEAYAVPKSRHWGRWAAAAACVAIVAAVSWQVLPKLLTTETAPPTIGTEQTPEGIGTPGTGDSEATEDDANRREGESLGGVYLGMTQEEVEVVLGGDYEATEPREQAENYRDVCWYYPEINVRFVDEGEGWFVQELMIQGDSGITLSTGIGLNSTREEILEAYPDAEITEDDSRWSAYVPQPDGGLWMTLDAENGNQISLMAVSQESADILTNESIGGLKLGMSQQEVEDLWGADHDVSNSGPVELTENHRCISWFYPEAQLGFVDTGEGWFLNEILVYSDSSLTLSTGIGTDSTEEEVQNAYPEAWLWEESSRTYLVGSETGGLQITVDPERGNYIQLGPLTPDPTWEEMEAASQGHEPIINFLASEEIVVHGADGTVVTLIDKAAKKVSTVLTITEPEMAENPGESPKWWLDLGNGYYLAVYGHDDLATVYSGDSLDTTLATMTEELTGVFLDLDSTLESAIQNPTETWE